VAYPAPPDKLRRSAISKLHELLNTFLLACPEWVKIALSNIPNESRLISPIYAVAWLNEAPDYESVFSQLLLAGICARISDLNGPSLTTLDHEKLVAGEGIEPPAFWL